VPADCNRFIILALADRDGWGWSKRTVPPLVALLEEFKADGIYVTLKVVTGLFATSLSALERVHTAVAYAETMRSHDKRFASLGIGVVEGEAVAKFTADGTLDPKFPPLGGNVTQAARAAMQAGGHRDAICRLRAELGSNQE
jgi:hypothetical protein